MKQILFIAYVILSITVSLAFIALSIGFAIAQNDPTFLIADILPVAYLSLMVYTIKR